jgi:hypothetical protein
VFKGNFWERRLANIGVGFDDRRTDFQFALSMHTAAGMVTANRTLGHVDDRTQAMDKKMDMMMKMIQAAVSPQERRLREQVDEKGRDVILEDEKILLQLGGHELRQASRRTTNRSKADGKPYTLEDLRKDLRADPEEAIKKNMDAFALKFKMQQDRILEKMEEAARREGDRVIEAIGAGPHDRITDPVIVLFHVIVHHAYLSICYHRTYTLSGKKWYVTRRTRLG